MEDDSLPIILRHSSERACEGIIDGELIFVIPAKERVKKSGEPSTLRHSRESGNPEATRARLSDVFLAETEDWIPAFERVKKSWRPNCSSSFPRKRESRGGAHKTLRCFSCESGRLDSRFRGNDEVLSADHCLSLRRHFGVPAVICERRPIFSHARKRESRGGARKTLRCFSCGNERLDSRFRACEETPSIAS